MHRDIEIEDIEKMLGCGDPDKGFTTYKCLDYENIQRVPSHAKAEYAKLW